MSSPASAPVESAPDAPDRTAVPAGPQGRGSRLLWAALAGTTAGALTFLVLASGILSERLPLLLVVGMLALVPTAPSLARRVALNAALVIGWVPLVWWVDWPVRVNHGAVLAALVLGAVAAVVAASPTPARRARQLLPTVRVADALLPGAVLAAVLATHPLAFAATPVRALAALVPGADNYAHFAMFANLRAYGATSDVIGAGPDGSGWAFDNYPKGFHALVATLSELTSPHLRTGPESLVVYAHTLAVVVALGLVMVTAAVISMPHLRERPAIAVPVVALTWTALLWEPGQKVLANGFASFWLAGVGAAAALLISVSAPRALVVAEVAAVGGLLVCVSHTWTPLVIVAAPAALAVLVHGERAGDASGRRRRRILCLAVLMASAAAALKAVVILMSTVTVGFIVSEVSGFDDTSPIPTFALLVTLFYVLVSYRAWVRMRTGQQVDRGTSRRLAYLTLAPVLGVLSLTALLVMQMRTLGTTSYYFLKYLLGFELILACVTPVICGMLVATLTRRSSRRGVAVAVSVLLTALATQSFGHLPFRDALLLSDSDDGTASVSSPYTRVGIARGVIAALQSTTPRKSFDREYLPLGSGNAVQVFYPDGWYHAVDASLTNTVSQRLNVLRVNADTVDVAAPLVRRLLEAEPDLEIAVDPAYVDPLRRRLQAGLFSRIVSVS